MASAVERTGMVNSPARTSRWPLRKKEIVETRVARLLGSSAYPEIRRVACEFHEGMLFLRGCVTSYYLKQIAQTVVLQTGNYEEINNQLEVLKPSPAGQGSILPGSPAEANALGSIADGTFNEEDE